MEGENPKKEVNVSYGWGDRVTSSGGADLQSSAGSLRWRVQSSVWEHCVLLGLLGFPYNLPISAADIRARSSGGDGCGFLIVIY